MKDKDQELLGEMVGSTTAGVTNLLGVLLRMLIDRGVLSSDDVEELLRAAAKAAAGKAQEDGETSLATITTISMAHGLQQMLRSEAPVSGGTSGKSWKKPS